MNRFERVIEILDAAVGGPNARVRVHGAFWRGVSHDQFVALKVDDWPLVEIGNGASSTIIKALKGESPFGADLEEPPADAFYSRMPAGRDPVPPEDIAFIEKWIDEGCREDEIAPRLTAAVAPTWRRMPSAPMASSRTDDVFFLDPKLGWAVNSNGQILKTVDGENWVVMKRVSGYLRCIGFANPNVGWIGTFAAARRLLHSVDGGANWTPISPLPPDAPEKICGLSVVSDMVVYGSGTNEPGDRPGMVKTADGGKTWTAWDMRPYASILIDTYFTDALHGWVVGGKSAEAQPTRDGMKPVILETNDGGATWINRLAGQENAFPLGEWGWKIQFISPQIGFVSLENFRAAAICKTTDGGRTWRRIAVNDGQGNVDLEGIGFIDENRGWVGGWGPESGNPNDLPRGFSSATVDGGAIWTAANGIGRFLNRFRFFGNPVTLGYASGDTLYKYSAEAPVPAPSPLRMAGDPTAAMLPDRRIAGEGMRAPIAINVPVATRRLTLEAWDRFGNELGMLLDEIAPTAGQRVFDWDGIDARGKQVKAGDYIVRLTADDATASSIVSLRTPAARSSRVARAAPRRNPMVTVSDGKPTIARLMRSVGPADRDMQWLKDALQIAMRLEFATLPPYLTAYWTIKDENHPACAEFEEIWLEEMGHFGLICNLLVAIKEMPKLLTNVPGYPDELPGGVLPGLPVTLRKLDKIQADLFMKIEYPQSGPVAGSVRRAAETFDSIGEFYDAVLAVFKKENPPLSLDRQQAHARSGIFKIDTMAQVKQAIEQIKVQGEGAQETPEEGSGDLAHYYRFGQIYKEQYFVPNPATGGWHYDPEKPLPMPEVWNMADIPKGGYQQADVPDAAVWAQIQAFDAKYSEMLRKLDAAWNQDNQSVAAAVAPMRQMRDIARELLQQKRPDGITYYGPCFRYVP